MKFILLALFALQTLSFAPAHAEEESYTSICDQIGQRVTVSIVTTEGESITKSVIVGDPNDRCPGRCGKGCGKRGIYTQECLEHDVCEHVKGTSYGPCMALFKRAKHGFLVGQKCQ